MNNGLESARRQVAEYAMALDLLAGLSHSDTEKQAVVDITDVLSVLFSPKIIHYFPHDQGSCGKKPSQALPVQDEIPALDPPPFFAGNSAWTASEEGFCVKISNRGEALGIVLIDEIAFPEYKEQYLNLALSLADVCGLVIDNARKREELKAGEQVLRQEKQKLQEALDKIKVLSGIVPICMHCKKIRDDKGYWNKLEEFISKHSDAQFSHGICDPCLEKYYPEDE